MYELMNGSERLMDSIERRMDDEAFVAELADLLYYDTDQMVQDIQALRDRLEKGEKMQ